MNFFERARAIKEEITAYRRHIHQHPEAGLGNPNTRAYVMERLKEMGIEGQECGEGASAFIGQGEKLFLLRADMDALPLQEESGLEFASTNGRAHCCGHDMHTAMLLGAARLLKEKEGELKGRVRLMFQSGEEVMEGAMNMIGHGILDPLPDAALAYHVGAGRLPVGTVLYNDHSTMMFSMDGFDIAIMGQGCHGGYPHMGVDPINIGVFTHLALQSLVARESDPMHDFVLSVGRFTGGVAANVIPDAAHLEGSLRTDSTELRDRLVRRVLEVAEGMAATFGGSAQVKLSGGAPPLLCSGDFTREIIGYMQELPIPGLALQNGIRSSASEDFSHVLEKVPGTFIYLSAGFDDQRGDAPAHSPRVRFNEEVLPIGAACMAHCAARWLEQHGG